MPPKPEAQAHPKYELLLSAVRQKADEYQNDDVVVVSVLREQIIYPNIRSMAYHRNSNMFSFKYSVDSELFIEPERLDFIVGLKSSNPAIYPGPWPFDVSACSIKD